MNRRSLNILMVLRSPIGGLFRHVIDLSDELGRRGHQIGIIYSGKSKDIQTERRIEVMLNPPLLGVHEIGMPRLLGFGDLSAAIKIARLAKSCKADILHGHGAKGGFNARMAAMTSARTTSIYTPHGGVLHFSSSSIGGKILYSIERFLLPRTKAIIFESEFAKGAFEKQIGKVNSLAPVVHNGLLPNEFGALDEKSIEYDFAFVGEIRQLKGIHILLEAFNEVKRKDGSGANLIIGGGGPDLEQIRDQISNLNLAARVKMVGVKPALEVFAKARTVVVPSLAESLPYVVLEAAAAQKPVLASNVGGIGEIFGPTKQSLLPAGDIEALRIALQENINSPQQARAEMKTRLAWIKNNFSLAKMADGIEATYRQAKEN